MQKRIGLLALALLLGLVGAWPAQAQNPDPAARVEQLLDQLTLDQQIGQMFMVSIYGETLNESNAAFLRAMAPGGIAMFASNGTTPEAVTNSTNLWQAVAAQSESKIPYLIAIDHEGGTVVRVEDGFTALPWGPALGAMPAEAVEVVAKIAAQELKAVGVAMNLAPVADIRYPANPPTAQPLFMEKRAFGPDAQRVGEAVAAYVRGLQANGVISTLKHFPGHGSAGDSHQFLPQLDLSLDDLNQIDLLPFQLGIEAGAEVVMVAHLVTPALDSTPNLPASLSPKIIALLRGQLGFEGVIMTDAMDMGAIVENITTAKAAVMAVTAGIDLIATGPNLPMTVQLEMKGAILNAVFRNEISASRIRESVRRILLLKAKYNLLDWSALEAKSARVRVDTAAHTALLDDVYLKTVAVAYDALGAIPLRPAEGQRIAVIYPGIYPIAGRACAAISQPTQALAYSLWPSDQEILTARQMAANVDAVVLFTYNINENAGQALLANAVPPEKTIVIAIQNPYDFERGITPATYLTMFNAYPPAFRAACAILYGQQEAVGVFGAISG
jgi:beta-N-acetylhexosaminidase